MGIAEKLSPSATHVDPATGAIVSVPHAPEELTQDERTVFGLAAQSMQRILNNHGIYPGGKELNFLAAEVADFLVAESGKAVDVAVQAAREQLQKDFDARLAEDLGKLQKGERQS
jgi:hypothetical protein